MSKYSFMINIQSTKRRNYCCRVTVLGYADEFSSPLMFPITVPLVLLKSTSRRLMFFIINPSGIMGIYRLIHISTLRQQ